MKREAVVREEMDMIKRSWNIFTVCMAVMLCLLQVTVHAAEYSDDNSLSGLGIENAVSITPDFEYSTTEYEITVPEGTEKLTLNPTVSNDAATFEVAGEELTDGKGDVTITVTAESGLQAVYTLHVQAERPNAAEQIAAANEETETAPQTEAETEKVTEVQAQTETETESTAQAAGIVKEKMEKLKSDTDFSMKVIYGLIAFSVVLLFIVINLILKNRDLKDDLRDAQEKLELQTNEFARKERFLATDNYYAPVQQQAAIGVQPASEDALPAAATQHQDAAPEVEETFGAVAKEPAAMPSGRRKAAQPAQQPPQQMPPKREKKDVNVTMIDL